MPQFVCFAEGYKHARAAIVDGVSPRMWLCVGKKWRHKVGENRCRIGSFVLRVDSASLGFLRREGIAVEGEWAAIIMSRRRDSGKAKVGVAVALVVHLLRVCHPLLDFGCVWSAGGGGGGGGSGGGCLLKKCHSKVMVFFVVLRFVGTRSMRPTSSNQGLINTHARAALSEGITHLIFSVK